MDASDSAISSTHERGLRLLFVGDLILDEPDPDRYFARSAKVLREGDVVVGHVEVPHTARAVEQAPVDLPAPPAPPEHLDAMARAGFTVATMAGNHVFDAGAAGVIDTRGHLEQRGIVPVGAGADLEQARTPAIVERSGRRVGVLSYNCVGPKASWARPGKAGCAYLSILTHYELDHDTPGGPPTIYTFPTVESLERMREDLRRLRPSVDVLVVAFHKGLGHTPATIAMYERQVAREAIDAGADIVIGHHAHILRGIEVYRGRPIFHGLGNFVTVTRALTPEDNDSAERAAWAARREQLFGFRPDPDMPNYPFHPESRNTMIAVCDITADGEVHAGFVPCHIDRQGRPEALGDEDKGREVADYVAAICEAEGLGVTFDWEGDLVRVRDVRGSAPVDHVTRTRPSAQR